MKLANLLSGIPSISPVTLRMPNPALDVLGICEDDETAAKNRYLLIRLYTAEEFASASFSSNDTGCVMVCGCTAEKLKSHCDLIPPTLSLIGFSQSIGKQDILTAVECQFVKEQRLAAGTKMLFDAFLEDHCAQHIFDTAYRILKNPLFSCNIGNHYLAAVYDEEAFPADGPFARFILDDVLYRHVSDDGKLFIRHNKIDEALRTQSPLLFENTQLECQCLYGSLRMHNIPIGRVMMCAVEHPFSDFDIEMFERLCQFINHIIRMDYSFSYNGMNPEAVCLRDLLSSSYADEIMLKRSSASFNFPPNSHYQIAIVSLERPNADVDAINTLIYDLRGQFPNYPISALDGQTVILFPVDILGIDEKIREKMLDFSAAVGAMISLSNVFDTLREARAEYIKVSRTVAWGRLICRKTAL